MATKKPKSVSPIPKAKVRKGKFAGTARKNIGGTVAQPPPLTRYQIPKQK